MAFLQDSNAVASTTTPNSQLGAEATSAPQVGGSGAANVGTGAAPGTGVGSGGVGSFTNIQSYLDANKGDTGSAQNLANSATQQYSNENKNMTDQSNQALGSAKTASQGMSNDQADKLIKDASTNYDWSKQGDAYNNDVSQMNNALTGQFQGPTTFAYGLGADTQKYGTDLQNDGAFHQMMTDLYAKQAGTPLTSGQSALQGQFDTNNEALNAARQGAISQYGALQGQADQMNQDTTKQLTDYQNQYLQNQGNLRSYLGDQATKTQAQQAQDQAAARAQYQADFATTPTNTTDWAHGGFANMAALQHYMDTSGAYHAYLNGDQDIRNMFGQTYNTYQPAMNAFHNAENTKYQGADDADRKQFNSIQDFLGNSGARQAQNGFKVVG